MGIEGYPLNLDPVYLAALQEIEAADVHPQVACIAWMLAGLEQYERETGQRFTWREVLAEGRRGQQRMTEYLRRIGREG